MRVEDLLRELFSRVRTLETSPQSGLWRRKTDFVATVQSTTSTSYVNLATVGPTFDLDVSPSGTVLMGVGAYIDGTGDKCGMSFELSGENVMAPADGRGAKIQGASADVMKWFLLTGLDPGITTVMAKYRSFGGGTATFSDRTLIALPI